MPVYKIQSPAGRVIEMEGDAPPTEADIDSAFNHVYAQDMAKMPRTAVNQPSQFSSGEEAMRMNPEDWGFTLARERYPLHQWVADKLKVDPQTVADATDAFVGGMAGLGAILNGDDPVQTFVKVAGQKQRQPGTPEQTAAGVDQSVAEGVSFFASPEGAATLGLGTAPAMIQKAAAAAFVATMAHQAPEHLQNFYVSKYAGDVQGMAKSVADMGLDATVLLGGAVAGMREIQRGTRALGKELSYGARVGMGNVPYGEAPLNAEFIEPRGALPPAAEVPGPDNVIDVGEPRQLGARPVPLQLEAPRLVEPPAPAPAPAPAPVPPGLSPRDRDIMRGLIEKAIQEGRPVSAINAEEVGIDLPEGYHETTDWAGGRTWQPKPAAPTPETISPPPAPEPPTSAPTLPPAEPAVPPSSGPAEAPTDTTSILPPIEFPSHIPKPEKIELLPVTDKAMKAAGYKHRVLMTGNEGGFLAVDGYGNTPHEAQTRAAAEWNNRHSKRKNAPAPTPTPATPPAAPAGTVDLREAVAKLAKIISGGPLSKQQASDILAMAYGGTMAEGKFDAKDLGDAIEMAVNKTLLDDKHMGVFVAGSSPAAAIDNVRRIKLLIARLPTQTTRTKEQDRLQQFSTIPSEAYVAAWVAHLNPADVVLEPSAGVGGLAVFAKAAGAHVIGNELSDRRADLLAQTGIADQISRHNAEHIHALLTPAIQAGALRQPTAVIMNPPFSNAANTSASNTLVGAKHIEAALHLLPEGGRLVAIVGSGMTEQDYGVGSGRRATGAQFKTWWKAIKAKYNVRANIQVSGKEYAKYGTTFDNQLVVIDKTGPTPESGTVAGRVEKVEDLIPLLERIRNERPTLATTQPTPAKPGSPAPSPSGGGAPNGGSNSPVEPGAPGQPGRPGGTARPGRPGGKSAGGLGPTQQPAPSDGPGGAGARPDAGVGGGGQPGQSGGANRPNAGTGGDVTVEKREAGERKLNDLGVFSEYTPQKVKVAGAKPHPTPLVESTAMASVPPVDPKYTPSLPKALIEAGGLSDAQLENVVYAGQAHSKLMQSGERLGYFIGDGTGVGKGRQIAAIIIDNWNKNRRKAVWVSKSGNLINDAKRDLGDLGFDVQKVLNFWKTPKALEGQSEGIAFVPYSSLKSGNPGLNANGVLFPPAQKRNKTTGQNEAKPARIHQLLAWLGKDFDGVIVFDEAHQAGNAIDVKGKRGVKKASEQGKMVLDVQRLFPKARIVYASATGATDVTNLSYADRLGIWGQGTPFASKEKFFEQIRAGGLSAMEIVARDLKSMGRYLARTLSFEGVDHRQLVHELSQDQRGIYNSLAQAWQYVLRHRDETMASTNAAKDGQARSAANSAFYGAQQRFYNQLLTAMQMPSIIADMKAELAKGNSCVLQLVNTDEAAQARQIAQKASEAEEGDNYLEDLDLSPKEILLQYIDNSYPTVLYEPYEDENGNTKFRPVRDAQGNPVNDPVALRRKQELLDRTALLKAPSSPIGMILDTFGAEKVAEITGRTQRVVQKEQEDGSMKAVLEKNRSDAKRKLEAQEFQDGKRRVLVFSDAGGTGFSYHASRRAKNQQRRLHYLVQAGWRADAAMQGFGRTHRSDQAQAPEYVLPSTNIRGHQRFISTIARRLSELGALTGGERKSAGGEMFDETSNLENNYAEDGVEALFRQMFNGEVVAGLRFAELCKKLGYTKLEMDEKTGEIKERNTLVNPADGSLVQDKIPTIQQFLNRILSLEVDEQNGVFDGFIERMTARIEAAKADGSYDPGTQTLKAQSIRKISDESVYRDPESTAETRLVTVEHDHPQKLIDWDALWRGSPAKGFAVNNRSGRLFALKEGPTRTSESGSLVDTYYRFWVNGYDLVPRAEITGDKYTVTKPEQAQELWQQQTAQLPKVRTERDTYVVGTFLPIWDRLKIPSPKIWRIKTDQGENILGAHVPAKMVPALRTRLGAGVGEQRTPEQVYRAVLENGDSVDLANGWKLVRKRVAGESRIEILGVDYAEGKVVEQLGGFMERIQWTPRYFVPTDEVKGIETMRRILSKSPETGGTTSSDMAASSSTGGSKANSLGGTVRGGGSKPLTLTDTDKPAGEFMKDVNRFRSVAAPQTMGDAARFAGNLLRQLGAEMANEEERAMHALMPFRNSFDRTPVPKGWEYDPALPLPRNLAFIAAYEGGTAATLGPDEAAAAAEFARQNEAWLNHLHALGTGVLQNAIENYFPHLWDDPEKAKRVVAASLAKNPLQGSRSFLKQRTHELFVEGLKAGLLPVHDNPVDLWMLKRREVARYILGVKFCQGMKEAGLLKFVHVFSRPEVGWSTVNDRAFQVYGPPTVTIKEAFDAGLRAATLDVLQKLGVPLKRLAKIGGRGRWGFESHRVGERGKENITTKFGGPDWIIWHELGHVLDNRYPDMWTMLSATDQMETELRALADQRFAGEDASDYFKNYVRSREEKMAVVLQAYLHAPDLMQKVAPTIKLAFDGFLAAHPELKIIQDIRPSLRLGEAETEQAVGGLVKLGQYYMPDAAARVVNNYLSPGLNPQLWYRTLRSTSNLLNSIQLGLSAFHLGFTSLDAAVSRLAIGIEDAVRGDLAGAVRTVASVPVSPLTNIMAGARLRSAVLADITDGEMGQLVKALEAAGGRIGQDHYWKTQFTRRMQRAFHEGMATGLISGALVAPFALVEQMMRPIMEYIVPRQKLGVFADMAKRELLKLGPDASPEDVREAMRKAWDSVDNRMGQLVYDNLFYNHILKDVALLSFRAYGWQLGKYREGFGGLWDTAQAGRQAFRRERPEFTHRMAYLMALPLLVGVIGGIITYLATGRRPKGQDYFMPPIGGQDQNGNPLRVNLPSYVKDAIAYGKHPVTSFGHSLNPLGASIMDLLANRDFYDVRIRNQDDPIWKQGSDVAQWAGKQLVPFSVSGAMKLKDDAAPMWKQIAPFFGVTPAPARMSMTPAQELAAEITAAAMPTEPRTREAYERAQTIKDVVKSIKAGNQPAAVEALRGGLQSGILNESAAQVLVDRLQYNPLQFQVHHMTPEAAMRVWRVAGPDERAQISAIVTAKVVNSKTLPAAQALKYLGELKQHQEQHQAK